MTERKDSREGVRLLQVLAEATTAYEQRKVLSTALVLFEDQDISTYDNLCKAGAAQLVLKCLEKATTECFYDVATSCCQLLEQLLRCSPIVGEKFFHRFGTHAVTLLVALLYNHWNPALLNAMQTLFRHFASWHVNLKSTHNWKFLLRLIHTVIKNHKKYAHPLLLMATILLSGWTSVPENKLVVSQFPSLMDDMILMTLSKCSTDVMLNVAIILRHLVWDARNKVRFVAKSGFLECVEELLQSENEQCIRCAIDILGQLAMEKGARVPICKYKSSLFVRNLQEMLASSGQRLGAIQVLLRMIERDTASVLLEKQPELISFLSACPCRDYGDHFTTMAAKILNRFARHLPITHGAHPLMVDGLMQVAESPREEARFWTARALMEQSQMKATAFYLARSPLLVSVVKLANDPSPEVRSVATEVLLRLVEDTSNMNRLASNSEVMNVVLENAQQVCHFRASGRTAVQIILAFMRHEKHRKRFVKQFGFVASLSRYGTLPGEKPYLKRESLKIVRMLAPLM